ncbi:nucleoside deaminase [Mobilicoccus massiliensis]|uniref:nucleoside deaminase n=1 Tax=Mobilicoccus massiliensis TaxID=1522310 RepID=UPI00058B3825|nr:nucleoside deaminase [Mobilicoccus massiliensis]
MTISDTDRRFLRRAVDLAAQALRSGDEPFGSVLVSGGGDVLFEDHNHVAGGDATQHPEFAIARWAAEHVSPEDRARCVVYTSGEHCPMCAAAHAWVGLGRIVYAMSGARLAEWAAEEGLPASPVAPLPIQTVAPGLVVDGPDPELTPEVIALHRRARG